MAALPMTKDLKGWEMRTVDSTFPMAEGVFARSVERWVDSHHHRCRGCLNMFGAEILVNFRIICPCRSVLFGCSGVSILEQFVFTFVTKGRR